jgi:hypothetical protein
MAVGISLRTAGVAAALGLALWAVAPAAAQSVDPDDPGLYAPRSARSAAARRARQRIEIRPGRLLYRECVDGYREIWRPGWGTTVVTPWMRCHWVRG